MATRKIICIILALIFGLSLFASGAFARVICDREHCKHHSVTVTQLNSIANSTLEGVGCCAGTKRDPCDLERGQALELHDCTLSLARAENGDPSDVIAINSDSAPEDLSLMAFGPHPLSAITARSEPIYIKNSSLIL